MASPCFVVCSSSLPEDAEVSRDRAMTAAAIAAKGLDKADAGSVLFGSKGIDSELDRLHQQVGTASDVDDAMGEVIRNQLLDEELLSATSPSDGAPDSLGTQSDDPAAPAKPAKDLDDFARHVRAWATDLVLRLDLLQDAALATQTQIPGGRLAPFELSLMLRDRKAFLVHWHCNKTMIGRRCGVDSSGKIIWPTTCTTTSFPKESWKNEIVIHPALGVRARRSRILREAVPQLHLDLKRMAELNASKPRDGLALPPMGICYMCRKPDLPPGDEPPGVVMNPEHHSEVWSVRQCGLCLKEVHFGCQEFGGFDDALSKLYEADVMSDMPDDFDDALTAIRALIPDRRDCRLPDWATRFRDDTLCLFCQHWYFHKYGETV